MAQEGMSNVKPQELNSRWIDGVQLNKCFALVNWLMRMAFDPSQFHVTKTGSNMTVALSRKIPDAVNVRWKLTKYDYQSITVGDGTVRRGKAAVEWDSGGADDVTGISTASTTYYIYAKLASASTYDAGVYPESVTIASSTVWPIVGPPDDSLSRRFILLGWAKTNAAGTFTQDDIVQVQFSDYNVPTFIPDTNAETDAGTSAALYKSLQISPEGYVHLYDFPNGVADTPDANTKIVARLSDGMTTAEVGYVTPDALAQWLADNSSSTFWNDGDWQTAAAAWLAALPTAHPHANHSSFSDDSHNVASTVPYLLANTNGSATRNACHANMRIGDASNLASIGPNGRILYDDDGSTTVLCWDTDTWELTFSATNKWTAAGFLVDVTGAITLNADAASFFDFANKWDAAFGATSLWTLAGYLTVRPTANATQRFILGDASYLFDSISMYSQEIRLYGNGVGALDLGSVASPFSIISYNGVAGVDIANWTTKGGLTGAGVSAMIIQVADGSGGTKDIEVLARSV